VNENDVFGIFIDEEKIFFEKKNFLKNAMSQKQPRNSIF
jgi:hypothetical protein